MSLFTEEHRLFRNSIKKFVDAEITPKIDSWEKKQFFPTEIFKQLGQAGFLGILLPEEFGGVGGDYALAASWCEEFGKIPSVGFTTAVNMHSLVISPTINRFGSNEQKAAWLPKAIAGTAIGAYAFTEPNAGSDLSQSSATRTDERPADPLSHIFTECRREREFLVLALQRQESRE